MPVKRFLTSLIILITFFLSHSFFYSDFLWAQKAAGVEPGIDYTGVLTYLKNLTFGSEMALVDKEFSFKKDVAVFKLFKGVILTCSSYNDKIYGIYFSGEGEFSFTPPTKVEQDQLYRFYEKDDFPIKFKSLFLLFTDSTYYELNNLAHFNNGEISPGITNGISRCLEYLLDSDVGYSRSDFVRSILDGADNGFFYAHIEDAYDDPFFFQVNPYEDEEVTFMRPYKTALISSARKEIINQFPAGSDNHLVKKINKHFLDVISYKIESKIEDDLDYSAKCIMDFTSSEKNKRWTTFYLYEELEVDSIIWEDGRAANYYRMPVDKNVSGNEEIWLRINERYLDGEQHHFKLYYHGDLLEKIEYGWIAIKSTSQWYPRYDFRMKAYFGLIFHTPAKYDFVSVGDLIQKKENEDVLYTTWMCNEPIVNASFNIGKFEKNQVIEKDLPIVNVYMTAYGHNQIGNKLAKYGILTLKDAGEWIGSDVLNSLALFDNLFGKISCSTISVTEVPYYHGLAFPGLVHLSWLTYQYSDLDGSDEIFRAHEVAHQWWGIGVDYKTYHDKWLSEGFAEYCGLWYLQAVKNDNDLFFDHLERWSDEILNNRKSIFGSGQEAGPVWLGYRTSSSDTRGDYDLIIYKKGALILHMLRGMLLNINTMNEDSFKNMMRDYFKTYYGKAADTEDFKKIVSKHFGEDMGWFFNQFVYGTELPLYRFAYKTEKADDGKYLLTCRVIQENVPENFKMYIVVKLVNDDDSFVRFRMEMSTKEKIFTLPVLAKEPDEIIFNDLGSVLCEVDYESWD